MSNNLKKTLLATVAGVATLVGGHAAVSADTVEVESGDTLSGIAHENNTTTENLVKANNISNQDLIIAGQKLTVSAPTTVSVDGTTYTVQAGDTLSKIAQQTGINVAELANLNSLSDNNYVVVGQQLSLKQDNTVAAVPTVTASEANTQAPAEKLSYVAAADTNKDSFMSVDEYNAFKANGEKTVTQETVSVPQNVSYIAGADTNKDGFMSATEYNTYKTNGGDTSTTAAQAPQAVTPTTENVQYIAAADTNKDGYMTASEYANYQANGGQNQAPTQTQVAAPSAPVNQVTQVSTASAAPTQVSTAASSDVQTLVNSLNAKRAALGLAPVTLDAGLSAQAQSRAQNAAANGGIPTNHFSTNGEVVAVGFSTGSVIDAWFNETNMMTPNGQPGHRMWVANARASSVGFGIVGGVIVGESNIGQF